MITDLNESDGHQQFTSPVWGAFTLLGVNAFFFIIYSRELQQSECADEPVYRRFIFYDRRDALENSGTNV